MALVVEERLVSGRWLDRGNANVSNLGLDFGRFNLRLWDNLLAGDRVNEHRKEVLEYLIRWRNAIGHGDIARKREEGILVPDRITLKVCQKWNTVLGKLIISIEDVLATHCEDLGLERPW